MKPTTMLFLCALGVAAPLAAGSPQLAWSQDGVHYQPLAAIARGRSASDYYDRFDSSAHPGFGTAPGTASVAMFRDKNDGRISLILAMGHDETFSVMGHSGKARFTFAGLPASTTLDLDDDEGSTRYRDGSPTASARFRFTKEADGLIFGGLGASHFTIRMSLAGEQNVDCWRLVDGAGVVRTLDPTRPLYLSDAPAPFFSNTDGLGELLPQPMPVPEPTLLGGMLLGAGMYACRRRRMS